MPLNDFLCLDCGTVQDHIGPSDSKPDKCPVCHAGPERLEKQFSTFGSYKIKGNNSASVTPKKFRG